MARRLSSLAVLVRLAIMLPGTEPGIRMLLAPRLPLRLRGGMAPPPHIRKLAAEQDEELRQALRELALDAGQREKELKAAYPTAALSMARNGSVLENVPLCVTKEDFERFDVDPMVPQILPLGGANHSRVHIMQGQEVSDMVAREAVECEDALGRVNLSDPDVQLAHSLPGYRPDGAVERLTVDQLQERLGVNITAQWLDSMPDARPASDGGGLECHARSNRTVQQDWDHYWELVDAGVLPLETEGIGLEDYYEYMQVLNKELLEAATYGNVSGVHVLVQLGADVNYRELDPDFYYTPLMMASSNDETRAMEALLALGACVHERSVYNGTALHYAASNGHVSACQLLLQHGADPSAFAEWGGTPMEWALERYALPGAAAVVRLLAPLTDSSAQLGKDHPRPWLGPREMQGWFWAFVRESGVELSAGGWWERNRHMLPDPADEDKLGFWEKKIKEEETKAEALRASRARPREPEDPQAPPHPVADGLQLMGTPGKEGLRIGEYVDGSGGLDLALLDESWQRQGWRFEEHAAYRPPTPARKPRRPRVRKLAE